MCVTIPFDETSFVIEHAPVDWSSSTNIEKANLRWKFTLTNIQDLLRSPKCHLRYIYISTIWESSSVKDVISLITRGTEVLEK